jgi:hypothetical protein
MCYNIKDIDLTKASIETDSDDIIRTLIHESIKDSSTFYRTKAVVHALSLPEPFEMEAKIVRLGILNRIPLKEYSKQMTADIIEVIKLRKPKILHIGVGDDHESQITYFLNNPQK